MESNLPVGVDGCPQGLPVRLSESGGREARVGTDDIDEVIADLLDVIRGDEPIPDEGAVELNGVAGAAGVINHPGVCVVGLQSEDLAGELLYRRS